MKKNEQRFLMIAAVALLVFLADAIILSPYFEESKATADAIKKKRQELFEGDRVISRADCIHEDWKLHEISAHEGKTGDLAAAFQEDLLKMFKKAGVQIETLVKRAELKQGKFKELIFTANFSGSNDDLVKLMEVFDTYDGYLRSNMIQINAKKDKQTPDLDVKLEVSTIWFSAGNGGR